MLQLGLSHRHSKLYLPSNKKITLTKILEQIIFFMNKVLNVIHTVSKIQKVQLICKNQTIVMEETMLNLN